jgi:hypothetical protein
MAGAIAVPSMTNALAISNKYRILALPLKKKEKCPRKSLKLNFFAPDCADRSTKLITLSLQRVSDSRSSPGEIARPDKRKTPAVWQGFFERARWIES